MADAPLNEDVLMLEGAGLSGWLIVSIEVIA